MAFLISGIIILVLKRRARRRGKALGNGNNGSGEVIMLEVGAGGQISRKGTSSGGDTLIDFKSLGQRNILNGRDGVEKGGEVGDLVAAHKNIHEEVYR